MKKFIAILMTCIMLLACVPFSVSAAESVWSESATVNAAFSVPAGDTYKITGTYTIATTARVEEGATLLIAKGGSIIFTGAAGRLINSGNVIVENGGTLNLSGTGSELSDATFVNNETGKLTIGTTAECYLASGSAAFNYGTIENIDKMTVKGTLSHQVTIPGTFTVGYSYLETWNRQNFETTYTVGYYQYQAGDADLDYTESSSYTLASAETTVLVPHGQKLFLMITPEEGVEGDWCDVGRMQITAGGQSLKAENIIDNDRGVFSITPANALKVQVYSTSYKDLVKIYEINLPKTEAYYVISKDGDVDVATVEFGKVFSFRVVLAPEYDKSDSYVYVNTLYMEPDEYGYYDVTGPIVDEGMATAGGVQEDIEIQVMGVSANASQEMMGSLVGFIQQIFSVIEEIFSYFFGIFDDLGNIGA